jgi:hypothetical protein
MNSVGASVGTLQRCRCSYAAALDGVEHVLAAGAARIRLTEKFRRVAAQRGGFADAVQEIAPGYASRRFGDALAKASRT